MNGIEAIKVLARHLMQCGAMMPLEWVKNNGEGSEFMQAFEMAMDALKRDTDSRQECKNIGNGESSTKITPKAQDALMAMGRKAHGGNENG